MSDRNDDIDRIEALLKKPSNDSRQVVTTIVVLILLVFIGIPVYWYISSRPRSVDELNIKKQSNDYYEIILDKSGWYDTGLWVPSRYVVQAYGETENAGVTEQPQPFLIAVDNTETKSVLLLERKFWAEIHTTNDPKLKSENTAVLNNQGKVYVRLDPEASRNNVKITLRIAVDTPAIIEENKNTAVTDTPKTEVTNPTPEPNTVQPTSSKWRPFIKWGLIVLGVIVGLFLLLILFLIIEDYVVDPIKDYFKENKAKKARLRKARY